jgi:predicted nucleotidyltransferase
MTRPVHIALPAEHRRLVLNILRANLPQSTKVWVFGSPATGHARRYSDLDLAIDTGRPLTLDEVAGLTEAFSDGDLPYKVDLADWRDIDGRRQQTIMAERVALTEATQTVTRK